jgi:hypothetical protein
VKAIVSHPGAHATPSAPAEPGADLGDSYGYLDDEMTNGTVMKPTYLTAQLRESVPYLEDAGWGDTARLLIAAAAEIERLRARQSEQPRTGSRLRRTLPLLRRLIRMR